MFGLFDRVSAGISRKAQTLDQLPGFLMGPESRSGVAVTWSTALQVATMFACCSVVAEGLAQCGMRLMRPRKDGKGSDLARDHALFRLLYRQPNAWQTAFEFIETLVFHLMLVGNAYVFVSRGAGDRIIELIILEPGRVTVTRQRDLSLRYDVAAEDGTALRMLTAREVWHLRGPSWNGWMGMETVRLAREALGLALALEQSHAEQHANGLKIPGVYSVEGELKGEQHKQLSAWIRKHAEAGNRDPLILDRAAKWMQQQMTGVDAQHVEVRRFQVEEVCRGARVMPIMVGLADSGLSYSSSEQMFQAHVTHTLQPKAERIEQSAELALLTDAEKRDGLEFAFDLEPLAHADFKSRQEGLQIQRRNGVINANEWRRKLGENPREDEGGEQYIVEGNMAVQDGRDLVPVATVKIKE